MKAAGKHKYDTYRKIRLGLFIRSYVGYSICNYIKTKHKIDGNLSTSQLQEQFYGKRIIPEISRLSRTLNLNYQLLWRFVVLNRINFRTRHDKQLALSRVYSTLKNPFYYGSFEFNDQLYKGNHSAIVTKAIFDKVQKQLVVPPKEWHKKVFPFKTLCVCGSCKGGVTAEEKFKKLKYGGFTKHIYYHCGRSVDYECDEPYITEEDLIQQLIGHINNIKINEKLITTRLKAEIERFHELRSQVLHQEYLDGNLNQFDYSEKDPISEETAKAYLLHSLKAGTSEERQLILSAIKTKFILRQRELQIQ